MLPERPPLIRALSFDDVIVMPGGPLVPASKVTLDTPFTKNHALKRPFVGRVENAKDAMTLAQQGLLGILADTLSFGAQIDAVRQIKRHQAKLVRQPHTISPDTNVAEAQDLQTQHHFSALPVVDPTTHKVVGIVTRQDITRAADPADPVSSVMVTDLFSVREDTPDKEVQRILQEQMVGQVLVVDEAGHLIGLRTASDYAKRSANPFATLDLYGRLAVGATVGVGPEQQDRASALIEMGIDVLLIDQPYAHSSVVQDMLTYIRRQRSDQVVTVIAGHVSTGDGARALIDSGADMLYVRTEHASFENGVGVPGFTALQAVTEAAALLSVPVWVGGEFDPSIAVKALAVGATGLLAPYHDGENLAKSFETVATAIGQAGATGAKSLWTVGRLATLR